MADWKKIEHLREDPAAAKHAETAEKSVKTAEKAAKTAEKPAKETATVTETAGTAAAVTAAAKKSAASDENVPAAAVSVSVTAENSAPEQNADKTAQKNAKKTQKKQNKTQKKTEKAEKRKQKLLDYARRMREKESFKHARFDQKGRRRGRFAWAPVVGFVMSLLSIVGAVSLVFGAVTLVRGLSDDTALRTEIHYFLQPLTTYNPVPEFGNVNEEDHDELLQAAVWRITEAERVRMLREKDDNTAYDLDENGRLIIPTKEITASYQYLFGAAAQLHHRSLEEDDLEYSKEKDCYYVPFNFISSLYQPVIDTIRRHGSSYHVKIAYVSVNDLKVDEHGNTIDPTPDMASYAQIYILRRENGHFIVTTVGEEAS